MTVGPDPTPSTAARAVHLVVGTDAGAGEQRAPDLVLAWARDAATGEPRYILELGAERRGARCGCVCPSCDSALVAVNAAKASYRRRPHFRHRHGMEQRDCMVLAARLAVVRLFQDEGFVDLPGRRVSARAEGRGGIAHEAWAEHPAERVAVARVNYQDRAAALLTLADGRTLRVELVGSAGDAESPAAADPACATIRIDVQESAVAGMDAADIRRRLALLPAPLTWCQHWADDALQEAAAAAAEAQAQRQPGSLDDGIAIGDGMDPALRHETLLHLEVKRILLDAGRLSVPGLGAAAEAGGWHDGRAAAAHLLYLEDVVVEQRFGRLVPDVRCRARAEGDGAWLDPLFIEVTVTHGIDDARLARIRQTSAAALEIDLRRCGGRVTADGLRRLVVEDLAAKRWLHHPALRQAPGAPDSVPSGQAGPRADTGCEVRPMAAQDREQVDAAPIDDLAAEYLAAATALLDHWSDLAAWQRDAAAARAVEQAGERSLAEAARRLAARGQPQAQDHALIGRFGILGRLLSIRHDRGIGCRWHRAIDVLKGIRESPSLPRSEYALYFIAARVYAPAMSEREAEWLRAWSDDVKRRIRAGDGRYLRDPFYDALLSVLFPEMAERLASPGATRKR